MREGFKVLAVVVGLSLLAVIAGLLFDLSYSSYPVGRHHDQEANRNETDSNQPNDYTDYTALFLKVITGQDLQETAEYCTKETEDKSDRWVRDYHCNIKVSDAISAVSALSTVFLTICLILIGFFQFLIVRIQASTMKSQLSAAHRPWVRVAIEVGGDLEYFGRMFVSSPVTACVKNTGNSPAFDIRFHYEMFPVSILQPSPRSKAEESRLKQAAHVQRVKSQSRPESGPDHGSLFPGQITIRHSQGVFCARNDFDSYLSGVKEPKTFDFIEIVGSVSYRSPFSKLPHQTAFTCHLIRKDGEAFKVGDKVLISELELKRDIFGTGIAE